jgi:hypothetical protein
MTNRNMRGLTSPLTPLLHRGFIFLVGMLIYWALMHFGPLGGTRQGTVKEHIFTNHTSRLP